MSRRQRRKQKRTSPAVAVAMLVVAGSVAFVSLRGQFGAAPLIGEAPPEAFVDEPEAGEAAEAGDDEAPGIDLLLKYGSWQAGTPVRMAFASIGGASAMIAAAPAGEVALPTQRWVGADPPQLRLGVVMVGDAARRAVVDGAVVGLGDQIGRAIVVAIERDVLVLTWGGKRLTYDLDNAWPREFRAELRRRGTDPMASPATGTTVARKESQEEEK
ncbi:MAG: hypothetical protein JNL08_00660 [Planctomycetes bacterium]|nr:hypothetical protein [Planctomycetota bacterium]